MRKITYTQAATCGENLKVRVTPEQYKKLKFAWINVGKKWFIEDVDIFGDCEVRFLYLGEVIEWGQSKDIFESDSYEEIELIDDISEYAIDNLIDMCRVYFWVNNEQSDEFLKKWVKDGRLYSFNDKVYPNFGIAQYQDYKKYTPPRLIRVNGVEVPAPLDSLNGLKTAWLIDLTTESKVAEIAISLLPKECCIWLHNKLLYVTKEDAIKRAEAMLKFEVVE